MKYIKEFFDFLNKLKVGDELTCKKECGFSGAYRQLPRLYDFEVGKKYKVIEVKDNSVTISSDQGTYFSDSKKSTQIFLLNKVDKKYPNLLNTYFPYLWDYFEKR